MLWPGLFSRLPKHEETLCRMTYSNSTKIRVMGETPYKMPY